MATITIRGIRFKTISITPKPDTGEEVVQGAYELISSLDKVLAVQSFGGYNGLKVEVSKETRQALDTFMGAFKKDVETLLGLETLT